MAISQGILHQLAIFLPAIHVTLIWSMLPYFKNKTLKIICMCSFVCNLVDI